ncbi:MAG: TetR/AcrR family transcriptional regulator [Actinomycetaceae bacterium]|nr:TetR/AcrR family transcriptional regulator [Actinomycetaceae bacterium]
MGRPPKFSEESLLDAALQAVAHSGTQTTVAQVVEIAQARPASLYYRFPTREVLLAALWVRSIQRFQTEFLRALHSFTDPHRALIAAAQSIPRYCRENPYEARALTLFHHEDLVVKINHEDPDFAQCPKDLRRTIETLNDDVFSVIAEVTEKRFGSAHAIDYVAVIIQQFPYGLVRPYIGADQPPMPEWLDGVVAAMADAGLAHIDSLLSEK